MGPIALYYDQGGYVESTTVSAKGKASSGPAGLMGRQVAGKEFLDAWLRHGTWSEFIGLLGSTGAKESLQRFCSNHPSSRDQQRRLRTFAAKNFHDEFLQQTPASVLHFPNPADPAYAWARQSASPHRLALSGVTHTLCTARAVEVLRGLVTDPWEEYDRLICTSTAVQQMVKTVTQNFSDYLRDRHGGDPRPKIGLETIPLGVNTQRFLPATAAERTTFRQQLKIANDEIAVLFVGRMSHHAKAHPFPMFQSAADAARRSGKRIRLLMVGWSPSGAVSEAFEAAAQAVAVGVRVDFVDGLDPTLRAGVWKAADVFMSLVDNIQETFGLVIVEAMASGLPVVASDWNGYRDLVVDGETGFLIPTWSVENTLPDLTSRLLIHEINYDHFLARATQSVTVDSAAAGRALAQMCEDDSLRRRMGEAGRRRALDVFDWSHVIARYETMWSEQDEQRQAMLATASRSVGFSGPAAYPPVGVTFRGYPTDWLADDTMLSTPDDAHSQLDVILSLNLMTHEADIRCTDTAVLKLALQHANGAASIEELAKVLKQSGVSDSQCRPTIAWLLKYHLLVPVDAAGK